MPTNEKYWRKRLAETAQRRFDLTYQQMQKELEKVYKTASKVLELETERLYYKLLDEELSRTDIWTYKHYRDLEKTINEQMVKIGLKEVNVLNYNLEEALRSIYQETTIPSQIAFNTIDETMVKQIVARSWSSKHFTSTVWDNKQKLTNILKKGVTEAIVLGKNKDKLVETVMQKMGVGFKSADTVVRTELMHTINEGQRQKYMDNGYDMGIILVAFDERLCPKCIEYANNEKPKPLSEIVLPTHPRCRCTVIPVIKGMEDVKGERLVKDPITGEKNKIPGNMTYDEWWQKDVIGKHGKDNVDIRMKKLKNQTSDIKQHKKYQNVLGEEAPKSFDKFQELKYTDSKKWDDLKTNLKSTNRYNKIVEESANLYIKGTLIKNIDRMDISDYKFAEDHINSERNHKVTKVMAQEYINNSVAAYSRWRGEVIVYVSREGCSVVNIKNKTISTAYKSVEYDEKFKSMLEVIKDD